jgi:hypothetical protein
VTNKPLQKQKSQLDECRSYFQSLTAEKINRHASRQGGLTSQAMNTAKQLASFIAKYAPRVGKAVLISAITPVMIKSASDPSGLPIEFFNGFRKG